MIPLIDSLYIGLQCVSRGYELLNPGQSFEIIRIIHDIMLIIVFFQLKMLSWLHKASLHVHPEALLALLDTYQSLLGA